MRVPLSWLRELVELPADQDGRAVAARLIRAGLEVETVEAVGGPVTGPLVVGRVLAVEVLTGFRKPIRWCQVDVGAEHGGVRGIICGASNFAAGDEVVVALPGAVLPGGFAITARETYGHVSDGMIASERELGLGEDHDGIIVLPAGSAELGADARPVLGVGDEVLDIAVTPDRGYALSVRGIARETAIAYGVAFHDPGLHLVDLPAPDAGVVPAPCGSDDLEACDLFTLRTLVGFDPHAPTPMWMRRRLTACGMRSVSLAVDVTNYVMLELGQPLHAFDLTKLRGPVRAARPGPAAVLETLDHVERALSPDDLVIADDRGPIGLAGTMGGLHTEIDGESTDIALEAAHFSAHVVARMSRRHRLSSEASRRFERGVDRVLAPYASARAMRLLLDLGGGHYAGMTAVEAPYRPPVVTMAADLPARIGGLPVDRASVERCLVAVGCHVESDGVGGDAVLRVTTPPWRPDLTDQADLVEEVLRLVGYDALPATLPRAATGYGLTREQRLRRRIALALAGAGFVEVLSYPFVGRAELDALQLPGDDPRRRGPVLANPLSDEQPTLRTTLLPGLLAAVRRNVSRGCEDLALFEVGSVAQWRAERAAPDGEPPRPSVARRPTDTELGGLERLLPEQSRHLAVALTGQREPAGWWGSARPVSWADAVDAGRLAAEAVGADVQVRAGADAAFHPGRTAVLVVQDQVVGVAGELHPRVLEALGLPARTAALELNLDALLAAGTEIRPAPAVLTHPVAKEDVALVVPADVPAADVAAALRAGGGDLLEAVRLFDVYRGSQVGEGQRSLAFALRFRAPDRTLSAQEVAEARAAAVAEAGRRHGAALRGA